MLPRWREQSSITRRRFATKLILSGDCSIITTSENGIDVCLVFCIDIVETYSARIYNPEGRRRVVSRSDCVPSVDISGSISCGYERPPTRRGIQTGLEVGRFLGRAAFDSQGDFRKGASAQEGGDCQLLKLNVATRLSLTTMSSTV